MDRQNRTTTHVSRVTETVRGNKTPTHTEEVIIMKKTTSTTSSMFMNHSEPSNRKLAHKSKAKITDDEVIRRFLEDRDHVIERLHRDNGDDRRAAASSEAHNTGVRKKTEEYVKVIERKACRM